MSLSREALEDNPRDPWAQGTKSGTFDQSRPGLFSCRDCGRQWQSLSQVHCVVCHGQYLSERAWDVHDGRCSNAGLIVWSSALGPVWMHPADRLPGWVK